MKNSGFTIWRKSAKERHFINKSGIIKALGKFGAATGKELSFNNINDANGAIELLKEFDEPTVVAVKHTNPCGVASGSNILCMAEGLRK